MSLTLRMYVRIVMIIYLLSDVFQMLLTRKRILISFTLKDTRFCVDWKECVLFIYCTLTHKFNIQAIMQIYNVKKWFYIHHIRPLTKLTHKNIMIKMMQKNINNLLYAKRPWLHKHRTWSMHMYTTTKSTLQSHNKSP